MNVQYYVHITSFRDFSRSHSKRVEMTVQGVPDRNNITGEIAGVILQGTIPAGMDNPNTVVQVSIYPINGPAFYFRRYKRDPLLVSDLENDLVEELLHPSMGRRSNLLQKSGDDFQFSVGHTSLYPSMIFQT